MKREFLEGLGLEKDVIDKIMSENGKDITREQGKAEQVKIQYEEQVKGLQKQITSRDGDLTKLKEQLTAAQSDAGKLAEAQTALGELQTKYEADQKAWEEASMKQAYEFRVKEEAGKIKFSSSAARKEFVREAIEKNFGQKEDGTLDGFSGFVDEYKKADPTAFEKEPEPDPNPNPAPTIVAPNAQKQPPAGNGFNFHFTGVRPRPTSN